MTFDQKNETWTNLKEIITADMTNLRNKFPNKILLPTIGNNDVIVHNSVPCTDEMAELYYSELFNIWFNKDNLPPNFDYNAANETFSYGGYYRYDFNNSDLSFIGLNTMFWNKKNQCMFDRADEQILWLYDTLKNNSKLADPRQFIISMHVFPGLNDFLGVEEFWHANYTRIFMNYVE